MKGVMIKLVGLGAFLLVVAAYPVHARADEQWRDDTRRGSDYEYDRGHDDRGYSDRERYEHNVRERLEDFDRRVGDLESEARERGQEFRYRFRESYDVQREDAERQLERIRDASDKSWAKLRAGMEKRIKKMKKIIDKWEADLGRY